MNGPKSSDERPFFFFKRVVVPDGRAFRLSLQTFKYQNYLSIRNLAACVQACRRISEKATTRPKLLHFVAVAVVVFSRKTPPPSRLSLLFIPLSHQGYLLASPTSSNTKQTQNCMTHTHDVGYQIRIDED